MRLLAAFALVLASLCAAETPAALDVAGIRVPALKMPLYVMEFHLWYDAPFGDDPRPGWVHGGAADTADTETLGPDWMRDRHGVGYPLVGPYGSGNSEVIRWQLRCLKATGVDGVFIQLFPEWNVGTGFLRLPVFEKLLRIAEEEGVKVAIHDEVQFRAENQRPAQQPAIMARRAGEVLAKYGRSPAYLRIDGKPAYAFQWWGQFDGRMSHEQLAQTFAEADRIAGEPAFWMPFRHFSDRTLLAMPGYGGGVVHSNCNNQFRTVDRDPAHRGHRFAGLDGWSAEPPGAVMIPSEIAGLQAARGAFPGKKLGLWAYPGFDNTTQTGSDRHVEWLPRRGGRTLAEALAAFQDYGCDFVMVSSWNDWEENTACEPGLLTADYDGDAYRACRILAAAKGRVFTPPPLPAKEALDPLVWQPLFGIDRIPPQLAAVRYQPMDPSLIATVIDSGSAVAGAALKEHGDCWWSPAGGSGLARRGPAAAATAPVELAPGQTLTFDIARGALPGGGEPWVAVECEGAGGSLSIGYPAVQRLVDPLPSDERKFALRQRIGLGATAAWRAEVRLLRGFSASATAPLEVRFEARDKGARARIARVHLFAADGGAVGSPGVELAGTRPESQSKTYRLGCPGLQTPVPGTVYLELADGAGNRSRPLAVNGSQFGPGLGIRKGPGPP